MRRAGVLVETGGETDRIGEAPAPQFTGENGIVAIAADDDAQRQGADRQIVRRLRVQAAQQRRGETPRQAHASSSGGAT